jgi:peptide chain release factor 1
MTDTVWQAATAVELEYSELERAMAQTSTFDELPAAELVALQRRYAELDTFAHSYRAIRDGRRGLVQLAELMQECGDGDHGDAEMLADAQRERTELLATMRTHEQDVIDFLLPRDADDSRNAMLEVRAGVGGDEGGLFARDLFGMYERFAAERGWRFERMSLDASEAGGYNEAVALIKGNNVFGSLKFESGVHRVQRVPSTETQGRVHTSTAAVVILPEAQELDIDVKKSDLRIETCKSGGAGGQHVNTTDSAVKILHVPTGITVRCEDERSQHKNKAKALKLITSRIYDHEQQLLDSQRREDRSAQIGRSDRNQRIRTYNFAQSRITEHRTNSSKFGMDKMLHGLLLDEFIAELSMHARVAKLKDFQAQQEEKNQSTTTKTNKKKK